MNGQKKVLAMLDKQRNLLNEARKKNCFASAGPLSILLIQGRIEMLEWQLTFFEGNKRNNELLTSDDYILRKLQEQKDLVQTSKGDRGSGVMNRMQLQGRIEMLEWLLTDN